MMRTTLIRRGVLYEVVAPGDAVIWGRYVPFRRGPLGSRAQRDAAAKTQEVVALAWKLAGGHVKLDGRLEVRR